MDEVTERRVKIGANRVRSVRESLALSRSEVAERIETNVTTLARLERGDRHLTLAWLRLIAQAMGTSVVDLLLPEDLVRPAAEAEGEASARTRPSAAYRKPWPIPVWGPQAGYTPNHSVYFDAQFLEAAEIDPVRCVVLEVTDQSMAITVPEGSVCLVDRRYNLLVHGRIGAFQVPDRDPVIRRMEDAGDHWVLRSERGGRPILWDEATMSSIGLVIWTARFLFEPPLTE